MQHVRGAVICQDDVGVSWKELAVLVPIPLVSRLIALNVCSSLRQQADGRKYAQLPESRLQCSFFNIYWHAQVRIEIARTPNFPVRLNQDVQKVRQDNKCIYPPSMESMARGARCWLRVASANCKGVVDSLRVTRDKLSWC